jgi:hypothetical protein
MTKIDWLAAGVLLIPSNVGLGNDQERWHRICNFFHPYLFVTIPAKILSINGKRGKSRLPLVINCLGQPKY